MSITNTDTDSTTKVDLLKLLHVATQTDRENDLMVIVAQATTESGKIGTPQLIPSKCHNELLTEGILEFNFIIKPSNYSETKNIEWELSKVFDMKKLPCGIRAVKVNAMQNAEIALIAN